MKTGILYFTTCFHGFGILRHVDPFVRMLHIYHNISHLKTPQYLEIFLPNTSQGNIHCAMRNPRLQLPVHFHGFIKTTRRYQLPTLLNNLNAKFEILKHVIANIDTSTLLGLKKIMENYFLDYNV